MPEHIITLADIEARRLVETGALLVVRPVMPQPIWSGWHWDWKGNDLHGALTLNCKGTLGAPSDVLVCKEAWGVTDMFLNADAAREEFDSDEDVYAYVGKVPGPHELAEISKHIVYRADNGRPFYWRPASTMPQWAVRFRPVVREAGVMRLDDDITYGACMDMGLDMSNIEYEPGWDTSPLVRYWNRRFRKYPWESNPWCWFARVAEDDHA